MSYICNMKKNNTTSVRKFKSFNIFTKDGQNKKVTAPRPMTLSEAMCYFNALSISGN